MTSRSDWVEEEKALEEEFDALFLNPAGSDLKAKTATLAANGLPTALCLSGGGIRSATFSLGVLQALAKGGQLEKFNYLSTVSGGGFVGGWLSRWRNDSGSPTHKYSMAEMNEPADGNPGPRDPVHPIRRLRSFSNYLSPSWGASPDSASFAMGVVLRFFMNALLWALLFLGTALLLRCGVEFLRLEWLTPADWFGESYLGSWLQERQTLASAALAATLFAPAVWCAMFAAFFIIALFVRKSQELLVGWSGLTLLVAMGIAGAFALLTYIPALIIEFVADHKSSALPVFLGSLVVATTIAAGVWSKLGPDMQDTARKFLEVVEARLLLILSAGTLVVFAALAGIAAHWCILTLPDGLSIFEKLPEINDINYHHQMMRNSFLLGASLIFIGFIYSALAGANRTSLNSLYGSRLIGAYLGSARAHRPSGRGAGKADDIAMAALPATSPLFHVVNMTLNLSSGGGHRQDWQERKGASFTATALRSGNSALGYVATSKYSSEENRQGLSLGRAITISGAAASPNMGYFSHSLTAMAMALLNIRLGWWLPNPKRASAQAKPSNYWERLKAHIDIWFGKHQSNGSDGISRFLSLFAPFLSNRVKAPINRSEPSFGMLQIVSEAVSKIDETSDWVYLSDGAHFDNLGLYEMIRRQCLFIVVVDAGQDGKFAYSDFNNAVRKIQVDFGVTIELPSVLPGQVGADPAKRWELGTIHYPNGASGKLIILKPLLNGSEPPSITGYAASSKAGKNSFPHHSTADQFFDETQFESYRALGKFTGDDLVSALAQGQLAFHSNPPPQAQEKPAPTPPDGVPPPTSPGGGGQPPRKDSNNLAGVASRALEAFQNLSTGQIVFRSVAAVTALAAANQLGSEAGKEALKAVEDIAQRVIGGGKVPTTEETTSETGVPIVEEPPTDKEGPKEGGPGGGPTDSIAKSLKAIEDRLINIEKFELADIQVNKKGLSLLKARVEKLEETNPTLPDSLDPIRSRLTNAENRINNQERKINNLSPERNVSGR